MQNCVSLEKEAIANMKSIHDAALSSVVKSGHLVREGPSDHGHLVREGPSDQRDQTNPGALNC